MMKDAAEEILQDITVADENAQSKYSKSGMYNTYCVLMI